MSVKEPHLHRQAVHKLARITLLGLLVTLPALLAGCATGREAQQTATPTVSGSISIGAAKHF